MRITQLGAIAVLAGVASAAGPADTQLTGTLRGVVESNLKAYNDKDAGSVLATMHTNSPEYERTRDALADQFRDLGVTAKLIDFKYMGHDDEFVVARVRTQVAGPPGSGFQDNVTDSLVLFHQQGGAWRLWSDSVLGVEFSASQP